MTVRGVKKNPDQGINGDIATSGGHHRAKNFANAAGQQVQREELDITSSNDNETYAYEVDGEEISYTASSDTNAEVAQALADKHNANSFVRGISLAFIKEGSEEVLVIESINPGESFPFTVTDAANLTYTNIQSAQEPSSLAPRKMVIFDSNDDPKAPEESDFAEKQLWVQVTASADGDYRVYLDVLGETVEAQYTASADSAAAIAGGLATSVEANSDYLAASAITDGGNDYLQITPEADGFGSFAVSATESPGEALESSVNQTGDDIEDLLIGLVVRSSLYSEQSSAPANDNVVVLTEGPMFDENSDGTAAGSQVFVEVRDSATNGDTLTSHSDGAIPLSTDTAKWGDGQTIIINSKNKI